MKRITGCFLSFLLLLTFLCGCSGELTSGVSEALELADQIAAGMEGQTEPERNPLSQGGNKSQKDASQSQEETSQEESSVSEEGRYSTPEEVALYLHLYGHLPANYLTKAQATELGWDNQEGNLWEVADGMSIGGDRFGNREGLLPEAPGRKWYECDVNYQGGYRGGERLCYSNDNLIYYSNDHYESFTLLYGGDEP